jgi:hypothetical protein
MCRNHVFLKGDEWHLCHGWAWHVHLGLEESRDSNNSLPLREGSREVLVLATQLIYIPAL